MHFNRKSVVVGAGYIAVEMAGILKSLGSDVSQIIRKDKVNFFLSSKYKNYYNDFPGPANF